MNKKTLIAGAVLAVSGFVGLTACGYDYGGNEKLRFNEAEVKTGVGDLDKLNKDDAAKQGKAEEKSEVKKSDLDVKGEEVDNLRVNKAKNAANFCKSSPLPAGEGKEDKGGTCVSSQLGEIAKNPVLIAMPDFPDVVGENQKFTVKVQVEDKFGPLDLNAFTNINGKASTTFLEHPSELDNDGRPLLHAHFGITDLKERNGLPKTNDYNAAFSGVQGVKGDKALSVTVSGLKAGFYRADVYAGGPGHAPNPTAKANQVQAFASVYFEVK